MHSVEIGGWNALLTEAKAYKQSKGLHFVFVKLIIIISYFDFIYILIKIWSKFVTI